MYYKLVFNESVKLIMTNIFTNVKETLEFAKGEIITGRVDPKDTGETILVTEDGYGCIVAPGVVKKVS